MTFATNHLGPFALTEALVPHLPDGANVVFVASAVEDPERKPAMAAGFRGARYISAEASARGEWKPGGSRMPGVDAYATSKQCNLATAMAFARETPRLRFNAVEPGFNPATGLGRRDANAFVRFLTKYIIPLLVPLLMPFMKFLSTPKRAARVITQDPDRCIRSDRHLLRRGRPSDARLRARARPEVHRSRRRRDARLAGNTAITRVRGIQPPLARARSPWLSSEEGGTGLGVWPQIEQAGVSVSVGAATTPVASAVRPG